LGSVEGVLDEKLALLRGLAPRGRAVVGDRPPVLARQARALVPDVRVAGWGDDADPDLRPTRVEIDAWGRHTFTWRGQRVRLAVAGRHAVQNALIALAAAEMLGVEPVSAVAGLATVQSGALRDEVRAVGDLTLVIDCYNANPQSVAAALDLLEARAIGSGRVALLGSMLELGEAGPELHRAVLADALTRDLDVVVATGAFAAAASHLAPPADAPALIAVSDQNQAYERLRDRLTGNEVVLLKGSRGVALERLVPRFVADFGGGEGGG
jgi:UDP-N-acetylmuramoyl-tripeptide--D-alanyl-D-alanine ligase